MQRIEVERHLEDVDTTEGAYPDDRKLQVRYPRCRGVDVKLIGFI